MLRISAGVHPPSGWPSAVRRDTATARPSSGAPEDTGQSEPNASRAPDSSMVRIRYCLSARSAPSLGIVSTVISASICAHSGCMLAMTPSRANRSISASSMSCACAMTGRRSRGPLEAATYSIASSAWRTAASPIAWTWICRPRSSTRRAASASDWPSHTCMPPLVPGSLRCSPPSLCGPEQYGASIAPVSFSTTPSAKNFTVRAVRSGEATSSTRRRASAKWPTCASKCRGSA